MCHSAQEGEWGKYATGSEAGEARVRGTGAGNSVGNEGAGHG